MVICKCINQSQFVIVVPDFFKGRGGGSFKQNLDYLDFKTIIMSCGLFWINITNFCISIALLSTILTIM